MKRRRNPPDRRVIAANVTRLREAKGWTKEELGKQSYTNSGVISMIERCKLNTSLATLTRLSIALGVTERELRNAPLDNLHQAL